MFTIVFYKIKSLNIYSLHTTLLVYYECTFFLVDSTIFKYYNIRTIIFFDASIGGITHYNNFFQNLTWCKFSKVEAKTFCFIFTASVLPFWCQCDKVQICTYTLLRVTLTRSRYLHCIVIQYSRWRSSSISIHCHPWIYCFVFIYTKGSHTLIY